MLALPARDVIQLHAFKGTFATSNALSPGAQSIHLAVSKYAGNSLLRVVITEMRLQARPTHCRS